MKNIKESLIYFITSSSIGFIFTFISLGGVSRLNPKRIDWIFGDNITSYIAQLFYLTDGWHFPLAANYNYGTELSSNLIYTGPVIPIALVQKLLKINPELQFFGFWILLTLILQLYFGLKIGRELNATWAQAISFSVLFVTPFLLLRIQLHFWLLPHFLILWALLVGIKYFKFGELQTAVTATLVCLSYLLNAYLLAMVLIILIFIGCDAFFHKKIATLNLIKHSLLVFSFLLLTIFIFQGALSEDNVYESFKMNFTGTYGCCGYNLISIINPQTGITFAHGGSFNFETFNFSSTGISLGESKGYQYEGFIYLGGGLIFLLIILLSLAYKEKFRFMIISDLITRKLIFVFIPMIFLYSVSNRITLGNLEVNLPIPNLANWGLSTFRASGRFMWIIAYLVIILIFINLSRQISGKKFAILIWLALILQCADLSKPVYSRYIALKNEKVGVWIINNKDIKAFVEIAKEHDKVRFFPPGQGVPNSNQINYWAWKAGVVTNSNESGRTNYDKVKRIYKRTYEEICKNNLDPNALYAVPRDYLELLKECNLEEFQKRSIGNEIFFWSR